MLKASAIARRRRCGGAVRPGFFPALGNGLAGRGIVVTRPREQAVKLAGLIESAGGRALRYPTVQIVDPPDPQALADMLGALARFELAIFVSPTAVERAFAEMNRVGVHWPASLRAAAVGPGTRRALERHGVRDALAPSQGADSEALLAMPELQVVSGDVVVIRGAGGRELLGDTLSARGARVHYAQCYRRVAARTDLRPLLDECAAGTAHAITVFSRGALSNLLSLAGDEGARGFARVPLFASHRRIATEAARLGLRVAAVAGPGDEEMVEQLVAYFGATPAP